MLVLLVVMVIVIFLVAVVVVVVVAAAAVAVETKVAVVSQLCLFTHTLGSFTGPLSNLALRLSMDSPGHPLPCCFRPSCLHGAFIN